MLILTRKIGETVVIGNDIYLTFLGVKGNQVRLGFDAPKELGVHRLEVFNKVKEEGQENHRRITNNQNQSFH